MLFVPLQCGTTPPEQGTTRASSWNSPPEQHPAPLFRLNLFETTLELSLKIVSAFVLYAVETLGECDSNLALEGHKPNTSPISLKRPLRSQGGKAGGIGPLSLGSPQRHMGNERIT